VTQQNRENYRTSFTVYTGQAKLSLTGQTRNAYKKFSFPPEAMIPLGRPRGRWQDNIKMDVMIWDGM
jgi:hypothetical protein